MRHEILAVDGQRAVQPLGGRHQHVARGVFLLMADHHRAAALHDAGLFGGDQFDAVAEIGLMVERDRHDDGDGRRLDDIGRIEAAAEADLDDGDIGRMFGKEQEGDGRQDLENGDLLPGIGLCRRGGPHLQGRHR